MTSPIKPPGSSPPQAPQGPSGPESSPGPSGRKEFREVVDGASQGVEGSTGVSASPDAGAPKVAELEGLSGPSLREGVVEALQAGKLEVSEAVELLLQDVVRSGAFGPKGSLASKSVEDFVRNVLEEDPVLLALVKDLGRA